MGVYDYEDQMKGRIKIANRPNHDNFKYIRIYDIVGVTPDVSVQYYTSTDGTTFEECPIPLQAFDVRTKYYYRVCIPITYHEISKFDYYATNYRYVEGYAKYLYLGSFGEIINRHVFKFTQLREEIIFIKGSLSKPGSTKTGTSICIVVNEKSFWNRLKFFKGSNKEDSFKPMDKVDPYDLLIAATRNSKEIDRITLRLVADEEERMESLINSLSANEEKQQELINCNIVDGAIFNITGFESHSKRLWIAYFQKFCSPENEVISQVSKSSLDVTDYKHKNAIGYYDPDNVSFAKYKLFYQGQ